MKPIIPRKFPTILTIMAPDIDHKRKMANLVFITALANGDIQGLRLLFNSNASETLAILEPRYQLSTTQKQEHLKNFPTRYQMDSILKDNVVGLAIKFTADYRWDEQKKWGVIEVLVKNGANPVGLFANADTTFETLKNAISWGADVNTNYKGYNALHAVVSSKDKTSEKIHFLIEQGINVNTTDPAMGTPLHLLLANEHILHSLELIALAKDKLKINVKDSEAKTPLLLAAKIRSKEIVKVLLETFKGKIDVNAVDASHRTALHFACAYGEVEMAEALIAAGANINAKDNRGNTPLHYANAKQETVRALLESIEIHGDRDIEAKRNAITNSQMLAIEINGREMIANKTNLRENISTLIQAVNRMDNPYCKEDVQFLQEQLTQFKGKNLISVCMEGHLAVVKLLLQNNVDVLAMNIRGNKPSDIAQDKEIKQLLIEREEQVQPELEVKSSRVELN